MIDESKKELIPIDLRDDMAEAFMKAHEGQQDMLAEHLKNAGLNAGIAEKDQGAVFVKGETIILKGQKFTVRGIGKKEIVLRIAK